MKYNQNLKKVKNHWRLICRLLTMTMQNTLKKSCINNLLKVQRQRFLTLGFFIKQSPPPRALIHGLKPFRIWLRILRENRSRGVNDTVGSDCFCQSSPLIFTFSSNYMYVMFTYVFLFPFKGNVFSRMIPRCHKESRGVIDRGIWSRGIIDTKGSEPPMSMTPLNPLPLSQWD
jgi:hypothetical protein